MIALILFSCVGCDQVTKAIARNNLSTAQPIYLMGDLFRFQYMENTGAFLGLGAELPGAVRFWALIVFVGITLLGMLLFVWKSQEISPRGTVGALLVIGGGFGNLWDRVFRDGAVVDFMNVGIGKVRTGVFNLADLAIMIGAGMVLVWGVFSRDLDGETVVDQDNGM
ncbi:MAG: signal peptidase II [Chloroflexi bacterium]|nr:signal peptidase II [Chloroflexota bacterium]